MNKNKCLECNKWFLGRLKMQKYCNAKCRNRFHDKKDKKRKRYKFECLRCNIIFWKSKKGNRCGSYKYCSSSCAARKNGEKRIVEKTIGRIIRSEEVVHHKNYLEDDNRPENLMLCEDMREHQRIHKNTRYLLKEFLREKGLQKELQEYMDKHYFKKKNSSTG